MDNSSEHIHGSQKVGHLSFLKSLKRASSARSRRRVGQVRNAEFLETRVMPAVITVTSLADAATTVEDGLVTLREALEAANTNTSVDGSVAGSATETDVIVFDSAIAGTIDAPATLNLVGEQLRISESVRIEGAGKFSTIIDANQGSRLFLVESTATDVTIAGLTLTAGRMQRASGSVAPGTFTSGGAVRTSSAGTLTFEECRVHANSVQGEQSRGGAVYASSGTIVVTDSVFELNSTFGGGGSGGAIHMAAGTLQISNSVFVDNQTTGDGGHGGAIDTDSASISIIDSRFIGNSTAGNNARGGAIQTDSGNVSITDTHLSLNFTVDTASVGGAIAVGTGTTLLDTVQLSENWTERSGSHGSAMFVNGGTVSIRRSSFFRNDTFGMSSDGALTVSGGDVKISQSTFAFNVTWQHDGDGAAISLVDKASLLLSQSTVSLNFSSDSMDQGSNTGGGITVADSSAILQNSVVAGNLSHQEPLDIAVIANGTLDCVGSLIGTNKSAGLQQSGGTIPNGQGNLIGGVAEGQIIDPVLGLPGYYGGSTISMPPIFTSPVINRGRSNLAVDVTGQEGNLATDQRGNSLLPRVVDSKVDMGACEYFPLADTQMVTVAADELDGNFQPDDLSFREAVLLANAYPGLDTIVFSSALDGTEISLQLGELEISDDLLISGNGTDKTILNAGGKSRVLSTADAEFSLTMSNVRLTGGSTTGNGQYFDDPTYAGAAVLVQNQGLTLLDQVVIDDSETSGKWAPGGGLHVQQGILLVEDSVLSNNRTTGPQSHGGNLSSVRSTVTIDRSEVTGGMTTGPDGFGGGVSHVGTSHALLIRSSTVSGNKTQGSTSAGGGVYHEDTGELVGLVVSNSTFSGNSTSGSSAPGGGLYHASGPLLISQSTWSGNSTIGASAGGGGMFIASPSADIEKILTMSTVTLNSTAGSVGGGIQTTSTVELRNSIVANNVAGVSAPDIDATGGGSLDATYSIVGSSDGSGLFATGALQDAAGNLIGGTTVASRIDPRLGPLQRIGGLTAVHVPLTGSPAIDKGSNELAVDLVTRVAEGEPQPPMIADQRQGAYVRILDGDASGSTPPAVIDIGAAEFIGLRITSPSPNAFTMRPTFRWAAIEGVISWNVHINNETTGEARFNVGTTNTNSYVPDIDLPLGKYKAWVQPVFQDGRVANWSPPETIYVRPRAQWTDMERTRFDPILTVDWEPLPGAESYEIWVDNFSTRTSKVYYETINGTSWTTPDELPMGVHRLWIRPSDSIGTKGLWSVLYEALMVTSVQTLTPSKSTFSPNPVFSWKPVVGAAAYELTLKNTTTNQVLLDAEPLSTTSYIHNQALANGQYTWTVWAVSTPQAGGIKSGYSTTNFLYVGGRTTLYYSPRGGAGGVTRFSWDVVDNAASYSLYVVKVVDGTSTVVVNQSGLNGSAFDHTSTLGSGTYRGWIRAVNGSGGEGPWSLVREFTITSDDTLMLHDTPRLALLEPELLPASLDSAKHAVSTAAETPPVTQQQTNATMVVSATESTEQDPPLQVSDPLQNTVAAVSETLLDHVLAELAETEAI